MKKVKGNLINMFDNGDFDIIIHGCNCFHTMGAGIALQLAQKYPEVLKADKNETVKGDINKLGNFSTAVIKNRKNVTNNGYVLNAYTQYETGGKRAVSYDAIAKLCDTLAQLSTDFKIGIPMIGAGLAGGDWDVIQTIFDNTLEGFDITLVEWDGT